MMDADTKAVYEEIVKVAKNDKKGITTYSEVASSARIGDWRIGVILDGINKSEHRAGRPLLSAVVTRKDTGMPGAGFFKLAKALGLYDGGDDLEYWSKELHRVYAYWAKR